VTERIREILPFHFQRTIVRELIAKFPWQTFNIVLIILFDAETLDSEDVF
jgi:hypothetical protein